MFYFVKYKPIGAFFWRKLGKVKGDLSMVNEGLSVRVFILEDETRIEIPALSHLFKFSKERHFLIVSNAEKQAGQKLPVN